MLMNPAFYAHFESGATKVSVAGRSEQDAAPKLVSRDAVREAEARLP